MSSENKSHTNLTTKNNTETSNKITLLNSTNISFLYASIAATIITHPLDTLKVRKQQNIKYSFISELAKFSESNKYLINNSSPINKKKYFRIIQAKFVMNKMYTGLIYHLQTKPIFWGLLWTLKGKCSDLKYLDIYIASNISSLITNPFFVLKTLKEVNSTAKLTSKNLFSGYGLTAIRNVRLSAELLLIDKCKDEYSVNTGITAFIVKLISNCVTYPLDTFASLKRINDSNEIFGRKATSTDNYNSKIIENKKYKNILFSNIQRMYSGFVFYNIYSISNYVLMFFFADIFIAYFKNNKK